MSFILKTVDHIPGASIIEGPQLSFGVGCITGREIVRTRVLLEVECYNSNLQRRSHLGLIETPEVEQQLNAPRQERIRPIDPERQIEVALAAVGSGRVVILFNGQQVSDLDKPLMVTPVSEARFLRLVPLVGG